jgi:hypothetical protein
MGVYMSDRLSIERTPFGAKFIEAPEGGHGKTGQVKKASFFGREVEVKGQKMNAGSLIDFLKTKEEGKNLHKGYLFGLIGRSSDKEIQEVFNKLYPRNDPVADQLIEKMKKSFVKMTLACEPVLDESLLIDAIHDLIDDHKITFLTKGFDPSKKEIFVGIFMGSGKKPLPILHICIPSHLYGQSLKIDVEKVLAPLLEEAIKEMAESNQPMPLHFCCDYGNNQEQYVKYWQKHNGGEELLDQK